LHPAIITLTTITIIAIATSYDCHNIVESLTLLTLDHVLVITARKEKEQENK